MAIERDSDVTRFFGYGQALEFYDPSRTLQARIFLGTDNKLNIGDVTIGGGAVSGTGSGTTTHALDSSIHTGPLGNAQAPQFLLLDGTRPMTGDLTLDDGVGDSPALVLVGGSNDDEFRLYVDDNLVSGDSSLILKLCATDTGSQFSILNSLDVQKIYMDAAGNVGIDGNLTLDDDSGNSPSVQFVGGSNDDTASIFLRDDADAGESDLCVDLCSDVIASRFIIRNQSGTTMAWISATGRMGIVDRLTDENDQDSYIDIGGTDDAMTFVCGGVTMLDFVEDDAQDKIVVNDGGADIDFIVEASGVADALIVQGSDGQITLGVLGAGVVQSTAGGVLSSGTIDVSDISDLAYAAPGLTLSTANAEGAAETVIRTDATVAIFDATAPTSLTPDDSAAVGEAAVAARRDHAHGITCDTAGNISPDDSAAEGSASYFARSDHTHGITCAAAGNITPDASAAEGEATSFARSDHAHGITCDTAGNIAPDDSAAEGSASYFARSDHTHGITCAAPAANLTVSTTNAEGDASTFARSNHSHAITSSNDPGAAASILASDASGYLTLTRLTLDQGTGDAPILILESDDVDHGATDFAPSTNAYGLLLKVSADAGGVLVRGLRDADDYAGGAVMLQGFLAENADTTKSTAGRALVEAHGYQTSGTGAADVVANGSVFGIRARRGGSTDTVLLVDEDGDTFIDGNLYDLSDIDTYVRFDSDDSMAIVCGGVTMVDFVEAASDYIQSSVSIGVGTTPDRLLHSEVADSSQTTQVLPLRLTHSTSHVGHAAALFGVGMEYELEDGGGNMQVAAETKVLWSAVDAAAESPLYRITTYPATESGGPGYAAFWTYPAVDTTVRTIIPDGAGDVTKRIWVRWVAACSGTWAESNIEEIVPDDGGIEITDSDGGGTNNVWTLAVAADGSMTIQRTTNGTNTHTLDIACWMVWI